VDTAVLDGDLTPLLSHPTLCSVGFLDKHTYNVRNADVKAALKEKRDAAINRVRNGSLETFRYNELG
jgi:hypothetical protein